MTVCRLTALDAPGAGSVWLYPISVMRIVLSADHAGYLLKNELAARLTQQNHDVIDLGTHSAAPVDYPDSAAAVAAALADGQAERGIIVCGSGAGVSIAANKF